MKISKNKIIYKILISAFCCTIPFVSLDATLIKNKKQVSANTTVRDLLDISDGILNGFKLGVTIEMIDEVCNGTLTIPADVKIIEDTAFGNIFNSGSIGANIHKLVFPNTLEKIRSHAFSNSTSIQEIDASAYVGVPDWEEDYTDMFYGTNPNGVIYINNSDLTEKWQDKILTYDGLSNWTIKTSGSSEIFDVRDEIVYGFAEGSSIESINKVFGDTLVFPDSVTEIAPNAFLNFFTRQKQEESNLKITKIKLTYSIKKIGDKAFAGCDGILSVDMPNVQRIGESAFYGCERISKIDFPNSLVEVGSKAFVDCINLSELNFEVFDLPPQWIYTDIFCNNSRISEKGKVIIGSDIIGKDINLIKKMWKDWCATLKIIIDDNNWTIAFNDTSTLENDLIRSAFLIKDDVIWGFSDSITASQIETIFKGTLVFPNEIRKIENSAFNGVLKPGAKGESIHSIKFHNSMREIGSSAFANNAPLTNVDFGLGIERIFSKAFYKTEIIEYHNMPHSIKIIEPWALAPVGYIYDVCFDRHGLHKKDKREKAKGFTVDFSDYTNETLNKTNPCPYNIKITSDPWREEMKYANDQIPKDGKCFVNYYPETVVLRNKDKVKVGDSKYESINDVFYRVWESWDDSHHSDEKDDIGKGLVRPWTAIRPTLEFCDIDVYDYSYEKNCINGLKGGLSKLDIFNKIDRTLRFPYYVTKIGSNAFKGKFDIYDSEQKSINKIVIHNNIKKIDDYAFASRGNSVNVENINILDLSQYTTIPKWGGKHIFRNLGAKKGTGTIKIHDSSMKDEWKAYLTDLGIDFSRWNFEFVYSNTKNKNISTKNGFKINKNGDIVGFVDNSNSSSTLKFSNVKQKIESSAFKNSFKKNGLINSTINCIQLSPSIFDIGDNAFDNCNNIKYLDLTEYSNVPYWTGKNIFSNWKNFGYIFIKDKDLISGWKELLSKNGLSNWQIIDLSIFDYNGDELYGFNPSTSSASERIKKYLCDFTEDGGYLQIPSVFNKISDYAFDKTMKSELLSSKTISHLFIPKNIEKIGTRCFANNNLRSIDLSQFTEIPNWEGSNIFSNCGLKGIVIINNTIMSNDWIDYLSNQGLAFSDTQWRIVYASDVLNTNFDTLNGFKDMSYIQKLEDERVSFYDGFIKNYYDGTLNVESDIRNISKNAFRKSSKTIPLGYQPSNGIEVKFSDNLKSKIKLNTIGENAFTNFIFNKLYLYNNIQDVKDEAFSYDAKSWCLSLVDGQINELHVEDFDLDIPNWSGKNIFKNRLIKSLCIKRRNSQNKWIEFFKQQGAFIENIIAEDDRYVDKFSYEKTSNDLTITGLKGFDLEYRSDIFSTPEYEKFYHELAKFINPETFPGKFVIPYGVTKCSEWFGACYFNEASRYGYTKMGPMGKDYIAPDLRPECRLNGVSSIWFPRTFNYFTSRCFSYCSAIQVLFFDDYTGDEKLIFTSQFFDELYNSIAWDTRLTSKTFIFKNQKAYELFKNEFFRILYNYGNHGLKDKSFDDFLANQEIIIMEK